MTVATIEQEPLTIELPHKHEPYNYQMAFWDAMHSRGKKRAVKVWHRRAGKDRSDWNFLICEAATKKATYYYMLPEATQARRVIWDAIDSVTGLTFLDHIPKELLYKQPNNSEMKITLRDPDDTTKPGSVIQLVGSDNFNSVMGTPPYGVVFSEYSISDPRAWDYISPILDQNGGWAVFNFTPRGNNHAKRLFDMALGNDEWFCELLTVNDTHLAWTEAAVARARAEDKPEEHIQQEYYCSFEGAMPGSYYSKIMTKLRLDGRIVKGLQLDTSMPVHTAWDIGVNDATVIWFFQVPRNMSEVRLVDYYAESGMGPDHYASVLQQKQQERKWTYGTHYGPHDLKQRKWVPGALSLKETAANLGIPFQLVPDIGIPDGINAVRQTLPLCVFDADRCAHGIDALESYHCKWDEANRIFSTKPVHDWASHPADAFRYLSVSVKDAKDRMIHAKPGVNGTSYAPTQPLDKYQPDRRPAAQYAQTGRR